jgi:hypothetical protein
MIIAVNTDFWNVCLSFTKQFYPEKQNVLLACNVFSLIFRIYFCSLSPFELKYFIKNVKIHELVRRVLPYMLTYEGRSIYYHVHAHTHRHARARICTHTHTHSKSLHIASFMRPFTFLSALSL